MTITVTNQNTRHFLLTGDAEYFTALILSAENDEEKIITGTTHRIGQLRKWWPKADNCRFWLKYGEKSFDEVAYLADPSMFETFSFFLQNGDPKTFRIFLSAIFK